MDEASTTKSESGDDRLCVADTHARADYTPRHWRLNAGKQIHNRHMNDPGSEDCTPCA